MSDLVADLLTFLDRSPSPYHAAQEAARRLEAAGYSRLDEGDRWVLAPGDRRYVVRGDSSLAAFEVGFILPSSGGFRLVGSHVDSPNLRLKPRPDTAAHGYHQLAVEPYGGVLLHTWLDRDLSIAGRVSLAAEGGIETVLVAFGRPLVRVPSLAIHLNREVQAKGLELNAQTHMSPILGLEGTPALRDLLVTELAAEGRPNVSPEAILAFDLMLYETQPADTAGARGELLLAARLDNLASCHAAVTALARAAGPAPAFTRGIVLYDHEEVGSRTAQGAAGPFLEDVLGRIVAAREPGDAQARARAITRSFLISVDMAHAVHPNHADRHEPGHRPVLGGGPVIKVSSNQSYASDAFTIGFFRALCARVGVSPQHFVTRSDLPCGSTIGPIAATRLGLRTVDVGNPMLSMHSCREMAGTADVKPMIDVLGAFFEAAA